MRIFVLGVRGFPDVAGGIESYCEHLYIHMAKLGPEIVVFTRRPYVNPDVHSYKGISLIPVNCPRSKYSESIIHSVRSILKARKLKPDILHIYSTYIFAPLAKLLGMKVVINVMCQSYKHKKWGFFAKLFLRLNEAIAVMFADSVIAISMPIESALKEQYHKPVVFIPNGVFIPLPAATEEIVSKLGIKKHKYILTVGRFVKGKGFEDLIDAFNKGGFKDWKLVIVGHEDRSLPSTYSKDLKERAKQNENIILTGFIPKEHLQELYTHAGLFVLPSYYEGMPTVLLEAMSYGLSCIASDIPAHRNIGLPDDRLFRLGDINAIIEKIEEVMNKPLTDEEREKQISVIAEKYNWNKIAAMTMEVYQLVISKRN